MTRPEGRPAGGAVPRRRGQVPWARHRVLIVLLTSLLVVVLGVVVAVLSVGGNTGAARPAGTATPEEAAVTKGAKWLTGPSGQLLAAVDADLGALDKAGQAGQPAAGTQLASDARAALSGPMPPADARLYQSALKDFEKAGTYAASGQFSKATPLVAAGSNGITQVTAAANPPAPVNPPAAVNDSSG